MGATVEGLLVGEQCSVRFLDLADFARSLEAEQRIVRLRIESS